MHRPMRPFARSVSLYVLAYNEKRSITLRRRRRTRGVREHRRFGRDGVFLPGLPYPSVPVTPIPIAPTPTHHHLTLEKHLKERSCSATSLRHGAYLRDFFFSLFQPLTAPAGARYLRPLARRFLSTLRPEGVAMRARKPEVRARARRVPLDSVVRRA